MQKEPPIKARVRKSDAYLLLLALLNHFRKVGDMVGLYPVIRVGDQPKSVVLADIESFLIITKPF